MGDVINSTTRPVLGNSPGVCLLSIIDREAPGARPGSVSENSERTAAPRRGGRTRGPRGAPAAPPLATCGSSTLKGFARGSGGKESACNTGDPGKIRHSASGAPTHCKRPSPPCGRGGSQDSHPVSIAGRARAQQRHCCAAKALTPPVVGTTHPPRPLRRGSGAGTACQT